MTTSLARACGALLLTAACFSESDVTSDEGSEMSRAVEIEEVMKDGRLLSRREAMPGDSTGLGWTRTAADIPSGRSEDSFTSTMLTLGASTVKGCEGSTGSSKPRPALATDMAMDSRSPYLAAPNWDPPIACVRNIEGDPPKLVLKSDGWGLCESR